MASVLSKLKGTRVFNALRIGLSGTTIKKIVSGTASLNPGSIATVSRGTVAMTVTGAAVGDAFIIEPPTGLDDDLIFCGYVVSTNTVTIQLYNPTGGPIDDGALTWRYVWIDLT